MHIRHQQGSILVEHEADTYNQIVEEDITLGNHSYSIRVKEKLEKNLMTLIKMDQTTRRRLPRLISKKDIYRYTQDVNIVIQRKIQPYSYIEFPHSLIYTGPITVLQMNDQKMEQGRNRQHQKKKPASEKRIIMKIVP